MDGSIIPQDSVVHSQVRYDWTRQWHLQCRTHHLRACAAAACLNLAADSRPSRLKMGGMTTQRLAWQSKRRQQTIDYRSTADLCTNILQVKRFKTGSLELRRLAEHKDCAAAIYSGAFFTRWSWWSPTDPQTMHFGLMPHPRRQGRFCFGSAERSQPVEINHP